MTYMFERSFTFQSPEETEQFAQNVSLWARPGQLILLEGDLGSGKSTFARALIKSLSKDDDQFDIPSPSFSLVQTYDNTRVAVAHIDLYRLTDPSQVSELGISELLAQHLVVVEWPKLLPHDLTGPTLKLHFSGSGTIRMVKLTGDGAWADLLNRNKQIEDFLSATAWRGSKRKFLEGDASSRRYETVYLNGKSSILMDMPQKPDGPPVKDGKPYSAIAHLAEGISAVVAINKNLHDMGYSAPTIEAYDLDHGLAVIENLGELVYGAMIKNGAAMEIPMKAAVALLADMAVKTWPTEVKINTTQTHFVPRYDVEAQLIEVDLLVSWFWPYSLGNTAEDHLHRSFADIWRKLLPLTHPQKPHWVLRDFHSPNLIWIPEREGLKRVGLIDTQDCLLGHPAYDLASFIQDARIDISAPMAEELFSHYVDLRIEQGHFDQKEFETAYAILGAQRATKILGIFARLAKRDGKRGYLQHMPRVSRYLAKNLDHPALGELKLWFQTHISSALRVGHA